MLGNILRISGGLEAEGLVDDFALSARALLLHASHVSPVRCYFQSQCGDCPRNLHLTGNNASEAEL